MIAAANEIVGRSIIPRGDAPFKVVLKRQYFRGFYTKILTKSASEWPTVIWELLKNRRTIALALLPVKFPERRRHIVYLRSDIYREMIEQDGAKPEGGEKGDSKIWYLFET